MSELFPKIPVINTKITFIHFSDIRKYLKKMNIKYKKKSKDDKKDLYCFLDDISEYYQDEIHEKGTKFEKNLIDALDEFDGVYMDLRTIEEARNKLEKNLVYDGDDWINFKENKIKKKSTQKLKKLMNFILMDSPEYEIIIFVEDKEIYL